MADVSDRERFGDRKRSADGDRDRGQLILVTGLAVAVTLVALVLLLNTVIYTQNLATRGAQIEDGDAVAFRGEVVKGVGGLLDAENREGYEDRDALDDAVREEVAAYADAVSRYRAEDGTVAEIDTQTVTSENMTGGALVRQADPSRNFTNAVDGDHGNWTLASDVDDARNVRLTVRDDELASGESDAFAVVLDDGTDEWRVPIYEASGDIAVGEGSVPDECTVSGPAVEVDLTAGTVNGTACPELDYPAEMNGYDVRFENPGEAAGTYELTVDTSGGASVEDSNLAGAEGGESPRWMPAVYAAEFEIHFETPRVRFHTTVRTAPGEPR